MLAPSAILLRRDCSSGYVVADKIMDVGAKLRYDASRVTWPHCSSQFREAAGFSLRPSDHSRQ